MRSFLFGPAHGSASTFLVSSLSLMCLKRMGLGCIVAYLGTPKECNGSKRRARTMPSRVWRWYLCIPSAAE
jgi:hypothetical protein